MGPHSSSIGDESLRQVSEYCRSPVDGMHHTDCFRSGESILHPKRALLLRELGSGPEFTSLFPRLNEATVKL